MAPLDLDVDEKHDPPRRYTLSYFLVLIFAVAPIWLPVPLSWLFVVYSLQNYRVSFYGLTGKLTFGLALVEVAFSIYHFYLARKLSSPAPTGHGNLAELQAAFTRVLKAGLANFPEDGPYDEETLADERPGSPAESIVQLERNDPRALDFRQSLRAWFGRVPWSSICVQEMYSWLYWSIFNAPLPPMDKLPKAHKTVLEETLDLLQKRAGCEIMTGSNLNAQPMRLTIDPFNVSHRPFMWYALVGAMNRYLKYRFVNHHHMQFGTYEGLDYLVHIPKSWNSASDPRPIVFIHGLGLGLFQYNLLLTNLLHSFPDRPLLFPLQPHISQDFFHPLFFKPMSRHQTADRIASLMENFGWVKKRVVRDDSEDELEVASILSDKQKTGVTMLSHSNGSYVHAWMLKGHPEMVKRSCLVDPVTFCSWEGDVCYNFIYRSPRTGIELLMRYFVGTELGVANLLQRHFDWSSNALWYEDIPNARDPHKAFFLLGGKDDIISSHRVKKYLRSHGVRKGLWYDPNGRHGQALVRGGAGYDQVLKWLREE